MIEYFHDGISSDFTVFPPHVSLSIREFDFGCCAKLDNVEPLPLSLTNHTNGKITVIWTNKPTSPFQVTPESCDISPLKSMAFRVTFQPSQLNSLYAAELEGFAFYKVSRSLCLKNGNMAFPLFPYNLFSVKFWLSIQLV